MMLERMILDIYPETANDILNSLHFADDTTIIAESLEQLNLLLEIVAKWADKYHLEVHPGKSVFFSNDSRSNLPVYKGDIIDFEKGHGLGTVGI